MVHAIHASAKREQPFTYEATAAHPAGLSEVTYPGILKNCETCHTPGSYDFSASASSAALPNLLWTTDAKGDMTNDATTNPTGITPLGLSPWVTTLGQGQIDYRTDNLVSSPIASACFACHDSSLAVQHMQSNGGTLVKLFSSVASVAARPAIGTASPMTFTKSEQCMLCHGSGKVADIKAMHAR
jgi:OmcA/MtrC family decaheme c-type cytochrome